MNRGDTMLKDVISEAVGDAKSLLNHKDLVVRNVMIGSVLIVLGGLGTWAASISYPAGFFGIGSYDLDGWILAIYAVVIACWARFGVDRLRGALRKTLIYASTALICYSAYVVKSNGDAIAWGSHQVCLMLGGESNFYSAAARLNGVTAEELSAIKEMCKQIMRPGHIEWFVPGLGALAIISGLGAFIRAGLRVPKPASSSSKCNAVEGLVDGDGGGSRRV